MVVFPREVQISGDQRRGLPRTAAFVWWRNIPFAWRVLLS